MPKYLIIVQRDEEAKSYYTFEDCAGISEFTAMLRYFNHPYEIYKYSEEYGYQRTVRWPAQM